jgi:adenosylcobinamide-GDP ribazoletransferase
MPHELRLFLVALQFLTRVPVPAFAAWQPEWLHQSAKHFPGVGLVIGAFGACVLWAASHAFSAGIAVGLSMLATVWLTGAFHEDGLADTFDGLFGHADRARALEIMKDSRLGTYGVIALVGVLGLKAAALHGLAVRDLALVLAALPIAHASSRALTVVLLFTLRYAGDAEHAKARPMAQNVGGEAVFVAIAWCGVAALAAAWAGIAAAPLLAAAVAVAATGVLAARWFVARLGGYTGDTLGAAQQLSELAALLAMLAVISR